MTRQSVAKKVRNISISIGILLVLIIGAGVAYSWFSGQNDTRTFATKPQAVKKTGTVKHVQLAANAPSSASVQNITSPVKPGDNASISIKSNPGSICSITVTYNGVPSKDSGLADRTTDEFGVTTWAWTVEPTVPEGSWPVTVTCIYNGKSAVVVGQLVVSKNVDN